MTHTSEGIAPVPPSADLLVALGRDREAVEAAAREDGVGLRAARTRATTAGGTMDGADQLDEIIPLIQEVVDGISADQIDAPTPCARFAVRDVLEHMIGGATAFAPAFRGEAPVPGHPAVGLDADALKARWTRSMADLVDAVHSPGADVRVIASPMGEVPGGAFARFVAFDGLVHGWDLATATGQAYAPSDDLVDEVGAFARQALAPEMRDGDTFAAETDVPDHAGSLERLVAFSGRRVPTQGAGR
jgi:uncharacterized protein (TIGR03086 family)